MRVRVAMVGPYSPKASSSEAMDIFDNIRRGIKNASILMEVGFAPICPWTDWVYLLINDGYIPTLKDLQEVSMSLLHGADAVVCTKGWENSVGSRKELEFAHDMRIPIFFSIGGFIMTAPSQRGSFKSFACTDSFLAGMKRDWDEFFLNKKIDETLEP